MSKNQFKWEKIKGGFNGFENLAHDYVANRYPNATGWTKTPQTRDGNKDAYAIIVGYRDSLRTNDQWWMEAKYSNKKTRLPRYRLDATIVSAILEGNVRKVIFVTNIFIDGKTQSDIRKALLQSTVCEDVDFCTKYQLEYWLGRNKAVAKKYFTQKNLEALKSRELFVMDDAAFYSDLTMTTFFNEPLNTVEPQSNYHIYFSLYSPITQSIDVQIKDLFKFMQARYENPLKLDAGENHLKLPVYIGEIETPENHRMQGEIFQINRLPILLKHPVNIVLRDSIDITIKSQEAVINELNKLFDIFLAKKEPIYHLVLGNSYVGKSFTIKKFITEKTNIAKQVISFTNSQEHNLKIIFNVIMFILFPYIHPDNIDEAYLSDLKSRDYLSPLVKKIVKSKDCIDDLYNLFTKIGHEYTLFNEPNSINARIIVLDDVHKIDENSQQILFNIMKEIANSNMNIYFIMVGWPQFKHSKELVAFNQSKFVHMSSITIEWSDLKTYIEKIYNFPFKIPDYDYTQIFPSMGELFHYIEYIGQIKEEIISPSDFLFAIKSFQGSTHFENQLIHVFSTVFENVKGADDLTNLIYWSLDGLHTSALKSYDEACVDELITHKIIKYDASDRLIPYHDRYTYFYKKKYPRKNHVITSSASNEIELLSNTIAMDTDKKHIDFAMEKIQTLFKEKKFYTTYYVLDHLFESNNHDVIKQRLGLKNYYELMYAYAHSVTNQSRSKSGGPIFETIIDEIYESGQPALYEVGKAALFERINSYFERLAFSNAQNYIKKLYTLHRKMQLIGLTDEDTNKDEKVILSKSIEVLIASELVQDNTLNKYIELEKITEKYQYIYENAFFDLRYSETLYYRDTEAALLLTAQAKNKLREHFGESEKFYMWANMDLLFLEMISENKFTCLPKLIEAHKQLKQDYYNDYRKRILVITNIYYLCGLKKEGDNYLQTENDNSRELRPRQKGFYHCTLALSYALDNDIQNALKELNVAKKVFDNISSYVEIINHNISVLKKNFDATKISFCTNNTLMESYFHIDPRCIW